jgi:hypothetical protein
VTAAARGYDALVGYIGGLFEAARQQAVRAVNGIFRAMSRVAERRLAKGQIG